MLRPWRLDDASALVDAWSDEDIQRWTGVPDQRDLAAAERWIDGQVERRDRWLSLDLVVNSDGAVAGEVGLASFDRDAGAAEIGWWTAPSHRRRRVASTSARLLAAWAASELGISVVARCDPANPASAGVAAAAGFHLAGTDQPPGVWVWA